MGCEASPLMELLAIGAVVLLVIVILLNIVTGAAMPEPEDSPFLENTRTRDTSEKE